MAKLVEIKTKPTALSVTAFIDSIANEQKRKDCYTLLQLMEKATKEKPQLWGNSMIGFGNRICKSPNTGREVAWFKMGFSPRKANLSLHLGLNMEKHATALAQLGKHKTGVGCLYINKLEDIDMKVLQKMIQLAADKLK